MSGFRIFWEMLKIHFTRLFKLAWKESIISLLAFHAIQIIYRIDFSDIVQYSLDNFYAICSNYANMIPIIFVVILFCFILINRWWNMYFIMPTTETIAILTNAAIPGHNEKDISTKKTIVRYALVSYILVLRQISKWMNKRFPTLQSIVDAGFLLKSEADQLELLQKSATISEHGVPLVWVINVICKHCDEQMINSGSTVQTLLMELVQHHNKLEELLVYSILPIPIVYLKLATVCIFSSVLLTLLCYQLLETDNKNDIVIDLVSGLSQGFIYLVCLKVGGFLKNPFDEDNDDFEFNKKMSFNLKVGDTTVNEIQGIDATLEHSSSHYESIPRLYFVDSSQSKTVSEYTDVFVEENKIDTYLNKEEVYSISYESCKVKTPNKPMYDYACGLTQSKDLSIHMNRYKNLDTFNLNNSAYYPYYEHTPMAIQPAESGFEVERKVNALSYKKHVVQESTRTEDLNCHPNSLNLVYENIYYRVCSNERTKLQHQYDIASDKEHDDIYESVGSLSNQNDYPAKSTEEENTVGNVCGLNCSNFAPKLTSVQESSLPQPMCLVHSLKDSILDSGNTLDSYQAVDEHLTCNNNKTEIITCKNEDKGEREYNSTCDDSFNATGDLKFFKEFEVTL